MKIAAAYLPILSLCLFCSLNAHGQAAGRVAAPGSRPPPTYLPKFDTITLAKMESYLDSHRADFGSYVDNEKVLIAVLRDALGATEVTLLSAGNEQATLNSISREKLAEQIGKKIRARDPWNAPVSGAGLQVLKGNRHLISQEVGEDSIVWPWFQVQYGELAPAKARLEKEFEARYASAMQATNRLPLGAVQPQDELEYLTRALRALEPEKAADYEGKLQKVKVHLSNLPEIMMPT